VPITPAPVRVTTFVQKTLRITFTLADVDACIARPTYGAEVFQSHRMTNRVDIAAA
jgi:hypothetical protein